MHHILKNIIKEKQKEVEELKNLIDRNFTKEMASHYLGEKKFSHSISKNELAIIGEIKRRSPSKGKLSDIPDPLVLLDKYIKGGVSAVSVLTEQRFFEGSLDDLRKIVSALNTTSIPVLRKDFIIDKLQIIESIKAGANCILLIVAILKEKTKELLDYAKSLGVDVIVEVHDKAELEYAVSIEAEIIGINNRNLHDFTENIQTCLALVDLIPPHIIKIAESAIRSAEDIKKVKQAGFNAVLIGEALVKANDPTLFLNEMRK